ncbi:hypothetical protein TI04_01570 [Achromatium sp. WMS2]|nr:hypothetical protein TI04_01570 [Achromatium sp. WMS2]
MARNKTKATPADNDNRELPPQIQELVEVLLAEIPLLEEPLANVLGLEMTAENGPPANRASACEIYIESLDRFGSAAESIGFLGLQQVVAWLKENITQLIALPRPFNNEEIDLLSAWSGYAWAYLSSPYKPSTCQELIDWLKTPGWPQPLSEDLASELALLLPNPVIPEPEPEETTPARAKTATLDLVSLELPADVQPDLLSALLQELPEQTQVFAAAVQSLVTGGTIEDINTAKRTAHTLKGAANTVGIRGLANLTHHLEDILDVLYDQKMLPTPSLANMLVDASDCLEAMSEALCGIGQAPDSAQEVLQSVLDWANKIDQEGGIPTDISKTALSQPATSEPPPVEQVQTAAAVASAEPSLQPLVADKPTQPSSAETGNNKFSLNIIDELLRLGGESIILGGQVHEQVHRIESQVRLIQKELERLQRLGADLERMIDLRSLGTDNRVSITQPEINLDLNSEFDSLELDQYNELHSVGRMLVETATDAKQLGGVLTSQLLRLDQTLLSQSRLQRETQEKVLSARMVPIKTIVSRLQRGVRQAGRLTNKDVALTVAGDDTLVDSGVLNSLIEPLMHVLRNAVDHGIEPVELRTASNKPQQGQILLEFIREGNHLLVLCKDDGGGLNYKAIRQTAESRGLLQPGRNVTEDELANLVLQPGFSTRTTVTQTSGRGMGLDVVYAHVLSRGGNLSLRSQPGRGTTTEIQLPVSLISTHAILTQISDQVIAISDRGIEQILHGEDGTIRIIGDQTIFQVEQRIYPLRDLEDLLHTNLERRTAMHGKNPILLVRERVGLVAIRVQAVLSGIDLVVKDLGQYIPHLPGIIGATILGDGVVTPVLDLPELIGSAAGSGKQHIASNQNEVNQPQDNKSTPVVLVVDDSLSARRALVQVMEDAGYRVQSARDGLEAVNLIAEQRPNIVLADMEMPRMNGIELTAHLRAHPGTANIPVVMITSRSTAKHRQQASAAGVNAYITKPFIDDDILEQVATLRKAT